MRRGSFRALTVAGVLSSFTTHVEVPFPKTNQTGQRSLFHSETGQKAQHGYIRVWPIWWPIHYTLSAQATRTRTRTLDSYFYAAIIFRVNCSEFTFLHLMEWLTFLIYWSCCLLTIYRLQLLSLQLFFFFHFTFLYFSQSISARNAVVTQRCSQLSASTMLWKCRVKFLGSSEQCHLFAFACCSWPQRLV